MFSEQAAEVYSSEGLFKYAIEFHSMTIAFLTLVNGSAQYQYLYLEITCYFCSQHSLSTKYNQVNRQEIGKH